MYTDRKRQSAAASRTRKRDVEILRRWAEPNFARINSLVKQGFDEEAAAEYDVLERREAALLDLEAERGLSEAEDEELARISQELAEMHRQATAEEEDAPAENGQLDAERARKVIEENARRSLVVRFVKRTDGTLRRMFCIYYPEAAERATFRFNPGEKNLIPVFDCEKGARRFISLDGVQSIKRVTA